MNQNYNQYVEEDEIDLRELFRTIMKNKLFIVLFTTVVTILALIYALMKTPIYEVSAILEMGSYVNADKQTPLDDTSRLVKELEVLYIDMFKNEANRTSWIESISVLKKQKQFLEIKADGTNNDKASKEIVKIVEFIEKKHSNVLDEIVKKRGN